MRTQEGYGLHFKRFRVTHPIPLSEISTQTAMCPQQPFLKRRIDTEMFVNLGVGPIEMQGCVQAAIHLVKDLVGENNPIVFEVNEFATDPERQAAIRQFRNHWWNTQPQPQPKRV